MKKVFECKMSFRKIGVESLALFSRSYKFYLFLTQRTQGFTQRNAEGFSSRAEMFNVL